MFDNKVTIVVTAADHPTGLGAARAVRKLGCKIIGLYRNKSSWCCRSRVWDQLIEVPGDDVESYFGKLKDISRSSKDSLVLSPIQDEIVQLASRERDSLGQDYGFVLPAPETVDLFMDKTMFHGWAQEHQFPVPESHVATSQTELEDILQNMPFPVIVKPLFRTTEWQAESPLEKVYKLYAAKDLSQIKFDLFSAAPRYVVQRWIEGHDSDVHFCLTYYSHSGEQLAFYTGRKLLQFPRDTGSTAICTSTKQMDLQNLLQKVFAAADYKGIGSLEAKYSHTDGKYYITEPTVGRPNLQSGLAVAGGVNFNAMAALDALGRDPREVTTRKRHAMWVEEYATLLAVKESLGRNEIGFTRIISALTRARGFGAAYMSFGDSSPLRGMLSELVGGRFRRRRKKP
ncbi:MAG: hypothetical protein JXA92_03345 [candidate division Zixibacteria bacterium]|nr:hypothetical protein [candidate division Zixibacteria bacterium]